MDTPTPSIPDKTMETSVHTGSTLYVATTLAYIERPVHDYFTRDIAVDGVCYRRLDAKYYAWLQHKITLAIKESRAGRLPSDAVRMLCESFDHIKAWATQHIGSERLQEAQETIDPRNYIPPSILSMPEAVQPCSAHELMRQFRRKNG